jgi:hypothetical protein
MALTLKTFLLSEYAQVTRDGKLVVAGIFDNFDVLRKPDAPADAPNRIVLPPFHLVAIVTCSIADGTEHKAFVRFVNDDGKQVSDDIDLGTWRFVLNSHGRPMKVQSVIAMRGAPVPSPGDYEFELHVDGTRLGVTSLYVTDVTGRNQAS